MLSGWRREPCEYSRLPSAKCSCCSGRTESPTLDRRPEVVNCVALRRQGNLALKQLMVCLILLQNAAVSHDCFRFPHGFDQPPPHILIASTSEPPDRHLPADSIITATENIVHQGQHSSARALDLFGHSIAWHGDGVSLCRSEPI